MSRDVVTSILTVKMKQENNCSVKINLDNEHIVVLKNSSDGYVIMKYNSDLTIKRSIEHKGIL